MHTIGNEAKYGAAAPESASPAWRELFLFGALKHVLGRRDLPWAVSLFRGVHAAADATLRWEGSAGAGSAVGLVLHLDAIILLANTAHPLDPRPESACSPLRVHAAEIIANTVWPDAPSPYTWGHIS